MFESLGSVVAMPIIRHSLILLCFYSLFVYRVRMDVEGKKKHEVILCEVCQQKPFKYTCPGCNKRTCSLDCVRRHKKDVGFEGCANSLGSLYWSSKQDEVRFSE